MKSLNITLAVVALAAPVTASAAGSSHHRAAGAGRVPVRCLKQAGLVHVTARGSGLWAGRTRRSGREVTVDGPYKTAKAARASAVSLAPVSEAKSGGVYVASAALRSHLRRTVGRVASCLQRSRR